MGSQRRLLDPWTAPKSPSSQIAPPDPGQAGISPAHCTAPPRLSSASDQSISSSRQSGLQSTRQQNLTFGTQQYSSPWMIKPILRKSTGAQCLACRWPIGRIFHSSVRSGQETSRCPICAAFHWSVWQGAAATLHCSLASSGILLEGLPSAWDRVSQACFGPSCMVAQHSGLKLPWPL